MPIMLIKKLDYLLDYKNFPMYLEFENNTYKRVQKLPGIVLYECEKETHYIEVNIELYKVKVYYEINKKVI